MAEKQPTKKVNGRHPQKSRKKQYSTEKPPTKSKPQAVKSQQSSTNKMNENKLPKNNVLVLGNSQIRRLDSAKLQHIKLAGVGGLKSGSILTTHKTVINENIKECEEIILHIGSNDIAKGISHETLIKNIDHAGKELKKKNSGIRITCSSIFLEKYNPAFNAKVVEANEALKRYCLSQGWDCIDHENIAFKHLLNDGMHLNPEGNRLFANNLTKHAMSG